MTSVFQTRRRAEEFAAAVDGAESRHASSEEVTGLLQIVATLRSEAPAEPRAEFTAGLRSRLMTEAETALRPETASLLLPVRERGRRERRLVAAASALVLVGGTATMAAAAQSSLPGEALYPIKRGIERAEVGLSMSEAGKGKDLLNQASDRLAEVEGLVAADSVNESRVPETLAEFSASATKGSALLFQAFQDAGDSDTILVVRTFTADSISTLEGLAADVPDEAQDELAAAAILVQEIDARAASLCGGCAADLPALEVPEIFLARAEVDKALERASQVDLQNSHPVVVPRGAVSAARPAAVTASEAPAVSPSSTTKPGTEDGTEDGADQPADPAPLPSPTIENPAPLPSVLPGLEGGKTSTEDKTVTEELAGGLTGAVETLLPDTGTGLLD
jgi:hypothetical protein